MFWLYNLYQKGKGIQRMNLGAKKAKLCLNLFPLKIAIVRPYYQ
jgi:hypothetical protein